MDSVEFDEVQTLDMTKSHNLSAAKISRRNSILIVVLSVSFCLLSALSIYLLIINSRLSKGVQEMQNYGKIDQRQYRGNNKVNPQP